MFRALILLLLIGQLTAGDGAYDPEDYRIRELHAVRLDAPLRLDGMLDEDLYNGPSYTEFIQYIPNNGEPGTEKTEIWIGYDDDALYVGARMWDSSPDSIVGRMGRRDDNFNSDLFEVIIDSYHDKRTGYSFQINPSGAIRDESYYNDSWTDLSWDAIWEGKTSIDDQGWVAELRIPFSQLRFNQQDTYIWGIFPTRFIKRRGEWDYYTYIPLTESGAMSKAATLHGIKGIDAPKRRSFLPYLSSTYSNLPSQQSNPFLNGRDGTFGLGTDMKLGIGGSLTMDVTLNPDFGQVEVDPSVINLSAFETFYDEKRPFFVEGRSIFRFGRGGPTNNWSFDWSNPSFFYSRRIGRSPQGYVDVDSDSLNQPPNTRILGAAKLSGKLKNGVSIGALSALTSREFADFYLDGMTGQQQVEPLSSYNLLRAQKEIDDGRIGIGFITTLTQRNFTGSSLGGIDGTYTLSDDLAERALTAGLDGWSFFGAERDWAFGYWGGISEVRGSRNKITSLQRNSSHYFQRPDADQVNLDSSLTVLKGFAGRVMLNKERGNIQVNSSLGVVSPGFETNDLGIVSRTDLINKHLVVGYRWVEPTKFYRFFRMDVAYSINHDFDMVKIGEQFILMGFFNAVNYWGFNWFINYTPETMSNGKLRGGPRVKSPAGLYWDIGCGSDSRRDIVGNIDYSMSRDDAGGYQVSYSASTELKLGARLNVSFGPSYSSRLSTDQYVTTVIDPQNSAMFGSRYVVAQLEQQTVYADIRINYTFTPQLSLQAFFQPFVSAGNYSRFKEFTQPEQYEFLEYGHESSTITLNDDGDYIIDPTGGDDSDAFATANPDFNFKALVGTAVLRWEFSPGSTAYLVWTRNGYNFDNPGTFDLSRDMGELFRTQPDDFVALKVSYWLGQ